MNQAKIHKIIAPAGCGKTTRLLHLIDELLTKGASPDRIVFTTFTRSGAYEARDRACSKFNLLPKDLPFFRTMHSLCYRLMGTQTIMTPKDWFAIGRITKISFSPHTGHLQETPYTYGDTKKGDEMLSIWNYARNSCCSLREAYESQPKKHHYEFKHLEVMATEIRNYKLKFSKIDFTDMLEKFIETKPRLSVDYVVVDEAQDLTPLQWKVIEQLSTHAKKVFVAGDDDQAIYGYSGATANILINLKGTIEIRDKSYRVPVKIQTLANKITKRIKHRIPKNIQPRDGDEGQIIRAVSIESIDMSKGQWAILTRNRCYYRWVESHMFNHGWLYESDSPGVYIKTEVESIMHWAKFRKNGTMRADHMLTCAKYLSKGKYYKPGFMKELAELDNQELTESDFKELGLRLILPVEEMFITKRICDSTRLFALDCLKNGEDIDNPRIKLSTIHGAKGKEFDNVVIFPNMTNRTYESFIDNPDIEHRLAYVAVTRAKKNLYLLYPTTDKHYDF